MDIHPQFGEIRTIKDFLIRFALIVLGVVVAVGVTQWRESSARQKVAQEMRVRLIEEINSNTKTLDRTAMSYEKTTKTLEGVVGLCEKAMKVGKLDAETVAEIRKADFDVRTPSLVNTQWQLANANLSVREFDREEAVRFADAYAFQHFVENVLMQHKPGTLSALVDANMLDVTTNAEQTRTTCRAYSYLLTYAASMRGNMQRLQKIYGKATGVDATAAASISAPAVTK
jgi:hypothetical protein